MRVRGAHDADGVRGRQEGCAEESCWGVKMGEEGYQSWLRGRRAELSLACEHCRNGHIDQSTSDGTGVFLGAAAR